MTEPATHSTWRPAGTTLITAALVTTGLALASISWWFFLLVALGTFGPGVAREVGILNDKDEFQIRAAHRAGYHAYLTAGILACCLVAWFRSGDRAVEHTEELCTLFLVVLWFSWFLSSLLSYWGARRTATRILVVFGVFWLLFTLASNSGDEWTGWTGLAMQSLLVLPFFLLAWLARHWSRTAGILLLAAAVFLVKFFGFLDAGTERLITRSITFVLFVGPLIASGIALLADGSKNRESAS